MQMVLDRVEFALPLCAMRLDQTNEQKAQNDGESGAKGEKRKNGAELSDRIANHRSIINGPVARHAALRKATLIFISRHNAADVCLAVALHL